MDFRVAILGEFPKRDPVFEVYVGAWKAYHRAADAVAAQAEQPNVHPAMRQRLLRLEMDAGKAAQALYLRKKGCPKPPWSEAKWSLANAMALEEIERGVS